MEDTRRINKLHGILLEDVRVQGLVEQASKGGFEVVDELPTENIKERTIYSVRKIDYYTSIYGTKIPTITSENQVTYEPIIEGALNSKGLTEEQVTNCELVLSMGAFMVLNLNSDGDVAKNIFENNAFSYELTRILDNEKKGIIYTATSITELYEYLFSDEWAEKAAELHGIELEGIQTMRDTLKSLNFKYQTTPLTADEIGVVFETTYDYYIYTGKEWVKLGEDVVIKEITNEQESNPDSITFTMEEFDKLWNGAQLVLKSTSLPLWQVCYVVQKIDLTTSPILSTKLLLYRTGFDFTIDDYDNINDISFGITIGENKIPTVFGYTKYYKPKTNKNVSIDWQEDDTYKSLGYNYKGAVQGYVGNTAIITFSPEDAASGNFSTFGTGGGADTNYVYYVYAKSLPDHTVTVNITVL